MKRSTIRTLKKARRLYLRRRYPELITFLEPQVFLFRQSYHYFYLLGMSCLYTGDYAGAHSYLRRALDIEEKTDALLGVAAVTLRRRQPDEALRTYLDILDLDNGNRRAKRALQWIKEIESPDEIVQWFQDKRFHKILPSRGFAIPPLVWVAFLAVLLAFAAVVLVRVLPEVELFRSRDVRPGSELLHVSRSEDVLAMDHAETEIVLTEREAQALIRQVGDLFNAGRDNMVRRELNRIALSNASGVIKTRAELLRDYLREPEFTTMTDSFTLREVTRNPLLHHEVFVRWRGRTANLDITEERIRFDLLVGYHRGQVLEGIVPVELGFAVLLDPDQAIEVIGRVVLTGNGDFRLDGTRVRILSPSEAAEEETR